MAFSEKSDDEALPRLLPTNTLRLMLLSRVCSMVSIFPMRTLTDWPTSSLISTAQSVAPSDLAFFNAYSVNS